MKLIGTNEIRSSTQSLTKSILSSLLYIAVLSILGIAIGSAFFEITPQIGLRLVYNGSLFLVLTLVGERLTLLIGAEHGKRDPAVEAAVRAFREERDAIIAECGTDRMRDYCAKAASDSYEEAVTAACDRISVDAEDYRDRLSKASLRQLLREYGLAHFAHAVRVHAIRRIRRITITRTMLISDATSRYQQRTIGETGDEYIERKMFSPVGILSSVFFITFAAGIGFNILDGISPARVIYVATMVGFMVYRMGKSYLTGLAAFPVVHLNSLDAKLFHLREYRRFCKSPERGTSLFLKKT